MKGGEREGGGKRSSVRVLSTYTLGDKVYVTPVENHSTLVVYADRYDRQVRLDPPDLRQNERNNSCWREKKCQGLI